MNTEKIGGIAFFIGLIVAIVAGLVPGLEITSAVGLTVVAVLAILGLVVGLINLTDKETVPFLVSTIALTVSAGTLGAILGTVGVIGIITSILYYIVAFVAPAAIVVSLKAIYSLASTK